LAQGESFNTLSISSVVHCEESFVFQKSDANSARAHAVPMVPSRKVLVKCILDRQTLCKMLALR
jgi:hypothetical protein